jgi:hypothetical protein
MFFGLNDVAFLGSLQPPAPLLLDLYPNAAAAYSLRQLRVGVTNVVRVRRASDNTEADFTAAQVSDGSLATWVGAGNNGFVRTWYDQSGNSKDAVQTTTANQPRIVSSGALILEGSKPTLQFDGAGDFLDVDSTTNIVYVLSALKTSTGTGGPNLFLAPRNATLPFAGFGGVTSSFADETYTVIAAGNNYFYTKHALQNIHNLITTDFSASSIHVNGTLRTFASIGSVSINAGFNIGARNNTASTTYAGTMQELIIYSATQSANRTAIEANINAHYAIY